jgi:hypothetical protein
MKKIPRELMKQFDNFLNAIEIPKDKHGHTKKVAALLSGFFAKSIVSLGINLKASPIF